MGTFLAFKISAPLIKPTRESLLDYCSYCLIVIAFVGLARVWIGGSELQKNCELQSQYDGLEGSTEEATLLPDVKADLQISLTVNDFDQGYIGNRTDHPGVTSKNQSAKTMISNRKGIEKFRKNLTSGRWHRRTCAMQDQTIFPYIIFIESFLLLFVGLIWPKVPKVSHTLCDFTEIIRACEKSNWAKKALNIITDKKQIADISQSLYSIISSECTNYDIKSLLDTLFHLDNDYRVKANARLLYEKVQSFCENNSKANTIWMTYVMKSLLQFVLWISIFNINLVLFVALEFYIMCQEDGSFPCDHDTFLRIMWFFAEMVLLIYAFFNCKTLLWISDKSAVRHGSCCNAVICCSGHKTVYADGDGSRLAYRFAENPPVYNDVALLLHLLEEAHPEIIPYFVVFMFPEWKEKLTSCNDPVQLSDVPIRTSMQMLSDRLPPAIEITDIPLYGELNEQREIVSSTLPRGKRRKGTVTFYIDSSIDQCSKSAAGDSPLNFRIVEPLGKPGVSEQLSSCSDDKMRVAHKDRSSDLNTDLFDSKYGVATDETRALIHRTSTESVASSENDSLTGLGSVSIDAPETQLLLNKD